MGQHFQGRIDEVRVYGSALAASEVAELAVASGNIRWLVTDHLGTPRMVVDLSGELDKIKRHDYLPFGEELIAGQGGRTTGQGYVADSVRQKFTGKERDSETGLDYMQARYFTSIQGRFTSCDPVILSKTHIVNPQRWNLYVYVNNNPLALIDPDGRDPQGKGGGKVIDVFLIISSKEIPKGVSRPNWNEIKKTAEREGYTVNIFESAKNQVTTSALANSLKNSEATLIVGHGAGLPGPPFETRTFELNNGYLSNAPEAVGMTSNLPFATDPGVPPETNASVVGMFTCNATQMAPAFDMSGENQTMLANNGGDDGYTAVNTLENAAAKFVTTYAQTDGNVNKAVAAANNTIRKDPISPKNKYNHKGDKVIPIE